ncbi:large subunit ribosomal protein L6 [Clostridium acetobutylicum]|jgi:large subunit ribosomal protein L6|uniref:Large ribosomal subunit protein uL6 n=1 Tax=Clostridium acetobutylicum (strain ATCC 824 / DSM 792 / JCM 1419 / IAM 19013 / LMG 5710 / NBRC 13948 / NRRL B-527 / VKM B-1787 / 2291 / W) TaxID=272562 RepID=RL6_CLOAB|nr:MULTISPECIES: 50S ribosomal protein L6 [Clostridium]Q97EJ3.1 RecName: Full=Large ribosomal subunit protein uL6; AltName: Full=50S ribosomal protein L6 [Clostridium acetobutylicum ATCC 824]AAK81057.1 Ribosomal protein L6 [Clostridium acetobutylicum ATCC 824]ADZ22160.1 50S ribosomal protein L6 [Clostridium acetobutylicum EA 2018]AEI33729.1 50S ribosomal protein L6 [Clostridium acetobutylicum DSM 1731]AWV78532.1 50S ribosomal protein L6 [Clostridium acetobutylicum]KHD35692.1 50S ribosomal pro
MSRVGKQPVEIPSGVTVTVTPDNVVTVKGTKGQLEKAMHKDMKIAVEDNKVVVTRPSDSKNHKALHGLTRALINNMVIGVTEGFSKTLQLVGVGYKAQLKGKSLILNLGYSHPIEVASIEGVTFEIPDANTVVVKGINKELVGSVAADIRTFRKPEPYKGKGIKYSDEVIRRKEGKTGK